jgi:hypothetical protein
MGASPEAGALKSAHSETVGAGAKMPARQQRRSPSAAASRPECGSFTPEAVSGAW